MPMLEVQDLKKYFDTPRGKLHAVDGISFCLEQGKTLGVVGESGCGKSTLGRTILHLTEPTGGKIFFGGEDVTSVDRARLKKLREDMQIIFQDPFSSLNPRMTVSEAVTDPLKLTNRYAKGEMEERVNSLMETVGLTERLRNSYPHELDGGRRQRIGVARALVLNPKFIVCDEPVSALDVSIQAQIINLLLDLQKERGFAYLFITHDLSVVKYVSHDICVMYLGQLVEKSPAAELFRRPAHPYTQALLSAIPVPDVDHRQERILLKGELSSPINPKPGCRFAARCNFAKPECSKKEPELKEIAPGHLVACHFAENKQA